MDIKKMRYKRLVTPPTRAEEGCPETCSKQNIRFLVAESASHKMGIIGHGKFALHPEGKAGSARVGTPRLIDS